VAKTIIVLNPANPPILMRNTIYTTVENPDFPAIKASIEQMIEDLHTYVPGYRFLVEPIIQNNTITTVVEVEGLGDFLPTYSGNLDIINSAAFAVGERFAKHIMGGAL
jgi:acetaldehyde dehydrogenase